MFVWQTVGLALLFLTGAYNLFFNTPPGRLITIDDLEWMVAQPFGVGMGGGYSGQFGRLSGVNVIGQPAAVAMGGNTAGARDIRANNSVKWDSPNFAGFTAGLLYRSPNSNGANTGLDIKREVL